MTQESGSDFQKRKREARGDLRLLVGSRHGLQGLLMLDAYAEHADEKGEAWLSVGTLAKRIGMGLDKARAVQAALVADGLLEPTGETRRLIPVMRLDAWDEASRMVDPSTTSRQPLDNPSTTPRLGSVESRDEDIREKLEVEEGAPRSARRGATGVTPTITALMGPFTDYFETIADLLVKESGYPDGEPEDVVYLLFQDAVDGAYANPTIREAETYVQAAVANCAPADTPDRIRALIHILRGVARGEVAGDDADPAADSLTDDPIYPVADTTEGVPF